MDHRYNLPKKREKTVPICRDGAKCETERMLKGSPSKADTIAKNDWLISVQEDRMKRGGVRKGLRESRSWSIHKKGLASEKLGEGGKAGGGAVCCDEADFSALGNALTGGFFVRMVFN